MAKVKVYRVGKLEVGKHSEEIQHFFGTMDAMKPAGHGAGRGDAIYVSPNTHGLLRWVRSALMMRNYDIEVHEVTVDSDDVFCYEIPAYERVSTNPANFGSERFTQDTQKFWESGMTLTDWLECASPEDGVESEILLDPSKIISSKRLSHRMVVNRVQDVTEWQSDLTQIKDAKNMFATI